MNVLSRSVGVKLAFQNVASLPSIDIGSADWLINEVLNPLDPPRSVSGISMVVVASGILCRRSDWGVVKRQPFPWY